MGKHIIVMAKTNSGRPCQIYERHRDFNYEYYTLYEGGSNEPVTLITARERLDDLEVAVGGDKQ